MMEDLEITDVVDDYTISEVICLSHNVYLFALNSSNNGEDFGALVNLFAPHFDISV